MTATPRSVPSFRPRRRLASVLAAGLLLAAGAAGGADAAAPLPELAAPDGTAPDAAATEQAALVYLRGDVAVEGPMVTLGDLLVGVPDAVAHVPVARAPEPGERGRVRTATVARAAQMHGIDWKPFVESRSIEVARRGRLIEQGELTQAILQALQPQLGDGEYDVYIAGRGRENYVAVDAIVDLAVDHIDYRPESGRFEASVRVSHEAGARPLRLTGQVTEMTELPVLRVRKENGEVISAADIAYRKVRADRIPGNVLTEAADLIGRTPRRAIPAGQNVRANDVIVPQDVQRNEMVTMVVNHGGMMLTTTGQALEAGARGEVIGVRNMRSKRVVRGVIVGPGEVHMLVSNNIVTQGRIVGQAPAAAQAFN